MANKLALMLAKSKPQTAPAPTVESAKPVAKSPPLSLDDLENSEDPGTHRMSNHSGFSDEVPATKPVRDLALIEAEPDETIRKNMVSFVSLIDGVFALIDDAEMLGNVIRSIMIELKSHPQYMKLVTDDDVRAWIQGMRDSMGLMKIKKEARKAGGSRKKAVVDADMAADLDSLLGDI